MSLETDKVILEEVIEHSPAFIAILRGPDFVYEKANSKYYELVGHRKIIGKTVLEALPEIANQGFMEILTKVLTTGEKFVGLEMPIKLQREPGGPLEDRFIDLVYQRIQDEGGLFTKTFAHGLDVTEKVLARKAIQIAARNFEEFANAMPHMAFIADTTGAITFFNNRWYEYVAGEKGYEGWGWKEKPIHHSDDLNRTIERWNHSLNTGELYEIEYRLRRFDGEYRWHKGMAIPLKDDSGKIVKWIGTNTDIHDYKLTLDKLAESESKFRTITDAMPQMVWSTTPEGLHDYFNDGWYEFTGVPYGSTDGEGWNGVFHPEDQDRAWKIWKHSLETGDPYTIEYRLRFRDGTYRWTLGRALPVKNAEGKIIRWMGTCTDIHDIKMFESELKSTQEKLEASLVARDEFLSVASHELKTPLTALKLQTQSMRRNFTTGRTEAFSMERVGQTVGLYERQISKLVRLVDDMLDLSRIQSGRMTFLYEKENLTEIVKEVVERMQEQMQNAGCEVTVRLDQFCNGMFDRSRIEQVIINLMTNAMKYGKGKPVTIELRKRSNAFVLSVSDLGIGISEENLEIIFQRFERAVSSDEISGLGLGLYITRQIVEGHRGRIWVESELNVGSTFYVELPV